MKIVVLNGSPKNDLSITLQYIKYIQKVLPRHTIDIINVCRMINDIKNDRSIFSGEMEKVRGCDGILWSSPVYYFLIPAQYKRFIELIWEEDKDGLFRGKYAASLTTSVHFYDHAAHNYLRAISDDLGMRYVGSFSADMYSLLKESEREKLISFAEDYFEAIERRRITTRSFYPLLRHDYRYTSSSTVETVDTADKKIVMVTDVTANDGNLAMMIQFIKDTYSGNMEIVDLNKMNFAEGCIGCLSCGFDNRCIFEGADIFNSVFDTKLKNADIIIYAGSIRDRFLSSQWKLFFDRSFFTNHIPSLAGKQMGFVISGPLHQLSNLREILEAYSECMHSHAVDFVTDEDGDPAVIDALLRNLASRLIKYAQNRYIKPFTFLSIGGRKILRDEIWGRLRFIFQADHRFYKKHRMYDYPQKDFTSRFRNIMMITLTKIPPIKRMFVRRIREEMVRPHRKIVDGYFATRRY